MRKRILLGILGVAVSIPIGALGQPAVNAEIASIRAEIGSLVQRLERLEAAAGATPANPAAQAQPDRVVEVEQVVAAAPRIQMSGDLRYRHETINDDIFSERHRQRIRARVGLDAAITDDIEFGLVLATGGGNPVSANQSLDGGFSRKSFGVDRAYVDWSVNESMNLIAGKMPNPLFRPGGHHLIWDSDANPEGLAMSYDRQRWFATVASFWVEERGSADDSLLLSGQLGVRASLGRGMELTAGLSYLDYRNTQAAEPFFSGTGQGNRVDGAGKYLSDFNNVELFGQLDMAVAKRPLRVFVDLVENIEANAADTGFAIGARYGEVSGQGTWEFGYAYQDLEADAVIAAFTDSDFGGGGTDAKGHVFEAAYGLADRWSLAFTYFLNERGAAAGNPRDYNRLQADINFRY